MSILIVLCIFLLSNFVNASYSIYRSCVQTEKDIKQRLDTFVVVKDNHWFLDYEQETSHLLDFDSIINDVSKKEYVHEYSFPLVLNTNHFRHYLKDKDIVSYYAYGSPTNLTGMKHENDLYFTNNFQINEGEMISYKDFKEGNNVMLISSKYRYEDDSEINIGDEISVYFDIPDGEMINTTLEEDIIERKEYRFKIIGKFQENRSNSKLWEYPITDFIIPTNTLLSIREEANTLYKQITGKDLNSMMKYRNIVMKLNSVDDIEMFKREFMDVVNDDSAYQLFTSVDGYNEIKGPLVNLKFISLTILCITICSSVLLFLLVHHLFIKNSEKEIGVLLVLGESFKNIKVQFISILFVLGMIGISSSIYTGSLIGSKISEEILNNQLKNSEQIHINNLIDKNYILNHYEVEFDNQYIIKVMTVWSAILISSTFISMKQIQQTTLKKLLQ